MRFLWQNGFLMRTFLNMSASSYIGCYNSAAKLNRNTFFDMGLALPPVLGYTLPYEKYRRTGGIAVIEATSCGGVVIFRGKILLLYKNYKNKYEGWVLPKGTVEAGEDYKQTALREVLEESGSRASIIKYVGRSEYTFNVPEDTVEKEVHWYLMMADSYYSKPQREEYFVDSGFYKYHEAYHLLKFANEKQILEKAYHEYLELKKSNLWGNRKYY